MTTICDSEYGKSFKTFDQWFNEYENNLKFRINKRNNEYLHRPFLWDCEEDFKINKDVNEKKNCNETHCSLLKEFGTYPKYVFFIN